MSSKIAIRNVEIRTPESAPFDLKAVCAAVLDGVKRVTGLPVMITVDPEPRLAKGDLPDEPSRMPPHADPAEVERLREELTEQGLMVASECRRALAAENERDTLRAQLAEAREDRNKLGDRYDAAEAKLAERDALLREAKSLIDRQVYIDDSEWDDIARKIKALSASAEPSAPKCESCSGHGIVGNILNAETCTACTPSAPVERDERALIELALSEYGKATGKHVLPGGINENQDGFVHGFLVRAALERQPSEGGAQ